MTDRDVLFLGCVMVTLVEVRIKHPAMLREVRCDGGGTFYVRVAVVPAKGTNIEEQMGESVDSAEHPLQNAKMAEELLLPVMFERTPPIASTPAPGDSSGLGASRNEINDQDFVAGGGSGPDGQDTVKAQLVLEIFMASGCLMSNVARRTVMIESLLDIAGQNCGVATACVGAVTLRRCGVWGQVTQSSVHDKSSTVEPIDNDGDVWYGVELQFIVRALDMSEPVRMILAAEREAHTVLRVPQDNPQMTFVLPVQRLPYGILPLDVLYHYYCRFFEHFFNKALKSSKHILKLLKGVGMDGAGFRWGALSVVDMRPVLLGEDAFAPLLATLYYCPSLTLLLLDQNSVGEFTCYRLAALFYRHRHLRGVSMCRNDAHECGAEQLLRLVRRNKHMTRLDASGNPCSSRILERIRRVTELNQEAQKKDPYNVLSSAYDYAVHPTSISSSIVKKALTVWGMLSVAPVTTADCMVNDMVCSAIPQCALAPLLNEVMRTVALRMSQLLQNPLVLNVFADIESYWKVASPIGNESGHYSVKEKEEEGEGEGDYTIEPEEVQAEVDYEKRKEDVSCVDVEELYSCSFLRAIVVTIRSFMLGVDWIETVVVLRDIGRRQRAIGVMPRDYRDALEVFVRSLSTVCGKEQADVEHSAAFLQCLAMGVRVVATA